MVEEGGEKWLEKKRNGRQTNNLQLSPSFPPYTFVSTDCRLY